MASTGCYYDNLFITNLFNWAKSIRANGNPASSRTKAFATGYTKPSHVSVKAAAAKIHLNFPLIKKSIKINNLTVILTVLKYYIYIT